MAAVAVDAELWAQEDVGHRVGLPFDAPVGVEGVAVAAVGVDAVAVGGVAVLEVLAVAPARSGGLVEPSCESSVEFQLVPLEVEACRYILIGLHAVASRVVGIAYDAGFLPVEESIDLQRTPRL